MSLSSQDSDSKSPIEFKEALLSTLNHEAKLFRLLYSVEPLSGIVLFEHQDIEYDLEIDFCPLDHPEVMGLDEETGYRQLKYTRGEELPEGVTSKPSSQALESFRSTLPKNPASAKSNDGDFFLPIGWFVENKEKGFSHVTRYACMLNVSTQPISMWAVYNYQAYNDEDDNFTNLEDLTQLYVEDILDFSLTEEPTTGARAVMDGKDLVLLYEDVKDWHPDRATVWNRPGKETYLLGKSVRAHADVLPPKELLDAITVKDGKQEPKTEICTENTIDAHAIHAHNVNRPTGKEDAVNGSAITGNTRHTINEYAVNTGDTVKGDSVKGDAVKEDAVMDDAIMDDAVKEDVVKGDAIGKPIAQNSTINDVAKLLSPNMLLREVLSKEVLPTKAKPKRTASRTMLAGQPARKQRNK